MRKNLLHPVERGSYVHTHDVIYVIIGELGRNARDPLPHVVDPHIDSAESGESFTNHAFDFVAIRYVSNYSK